MSVSELTWKDPLANQVISDDSDLMEKLPERLKESFMVNSSFFYYTVICEASDEYFTTKTFA